MATAKRVKPGCIDGRCGHPASDHDGINGVCWGRILTVLDTEANCQCTTYLVDEADDDLGAAFPEYAFIPR